MVQHEHERSPHSHPPRKEPAPL
jgi:hypothetical protein